MEDVFYDEKVTKIINVTNFSRRKKYEFVAADMKGNIDMGLEVRIYVVRDKHVSIYVRKETDDELLSDFSLTCLVSVMDVENSKRFTQSFGYIHQGKSEVFIIGIEKCFSWNTLQQNSAEFLLGDTLSLQFQLSYAGKRVKKIHRVIATKLNVISEKFFEAEKMDFIIETVEGAQHELSYSGRIDSLYSKLCCKSPVFKCLLESPCQEKRTRKIKIDDFDSATLSVFLIFIDTKNVTWSTDLNDVYSLYEMAAKYGVLDLMDECSHHLAKRLGTFTKKDTDDVMDIAKLAVMHCDRYLKRELATYFHKKETLLIGKINTVKLYQIAKKVKLIAPINIKSITFEIFENTQLTWKRVIVMKRSEDPCILFEISENSEAYDLHSESVRYMKQTISVENVPILLSLMKRCHNPSSLGFVADFIHSNEPYSSNKELKKELRSLLGKTVTESSSDSELPRDEEDDHVFKFDFYQ